MNKKIFLMLGLLLVVLVSAISINTFSIGLTSENLTFAGNQNISRNLTIPYNAIVNSATMNLSGYQLLIGNYTGESFPTVIPSTTQVSYAEGITQNGTYFWIADWLSKTVYKYWINGTFTGNKFAGTTDTYGITQNGSYIWLTDSNSNRVYKYYMNGTYTGDYFSTVVSGIAANPKGITTDGINIWVMSSYGYNIITKYDMSGNYISYWQATETGTGSVGITTNGTYIWISHKNKIYKYFVNGTYTNISWNILNGGGIGVEYDGTNFWLTSNSAVYKYSQPIINYSWNPYIQTNNTKIWNQTGEFNSTNSPQITSDFASILNTALNNGSCSGGILSGDNCMIPITFHSDTAGNLGYSAINIQYTPAPFVTLESPSNNSYSLATKIFNCSATDKENLTNLTFYFWNSDGSLNLSITNNLTGTSNSTAYNMVFNSTNTFTWGCSAFNNNSRSWWANSNFTINVDLINPNINIISPLNISYNAIQTELNYTANDTNLAGCWYSLDNGVTNSSYDSTCSNITGLTSNEGSNTWTVYANDSAENINSSSITFLVDTINPNINIISPAKQTYTYNESLNLNYTANDTNLQSCWFSVANSTSTTIINNQSTSCLNTTFNVPRSDTYTLTLWANDSVGNLNSSSVTFKISLEAPGVNLNSPTNNEYFDNGTGIYFNFTATDSDGLSSCELWGNFTGNWSKNYTWLNPINATQHYTTLNLTDNKYIWNVWCNDTTGLGSWSLNNFTTTVDTIFPNVAINSISTTKGSQTISFNSTESDTNLKSCKYSIFNSTNDIDGVSENITFTCNSIASATTTSYGTYNLVIYVDDLAGNTKNSSMAFSTSASTPIITGGGGGGITIISNATWTMTTDGNTKKYILLETPGASRTKSLVFQNNGNTIKHISLSCSDKDKFAEICKYITFSTKNITLPVLKDTKTFTSFTLTLPKNFTKGKYYFNIIATDDKEVTNTITVYLDNEGNNIFLSIGSKFFSNTNLFGTTISYLLLFVISLMIFSVFFYYAAFEKVKGGMAFSILLSLLISFGIIILM